MDLYIMIWVLVILLTITLSVFRYRSRQKKIDAAIRDQVENQSYVAARYQRHLAHHPNAPPAYSLNYAQTNFNQNNDETPPHNFNLQPRNQNEVFVAGNLADQQANYIYAPPSYEEVVLQFSRNDPAQIAQTIQTVPAAPTNNSNAGNNEPDNVRPPPYTIS